MPKKKADEAKSTDVNEPLATYGEKRIHFFKSLEEQENDNYRWLSTLTPEQHLKHATELIKRVFADDLKQNPTLGNRITFEK
jgi:hypothetical protein